MKRKLLSLLVLMFIGVQAALAQNDVTGQVVDENSEPLIGASVKVKGSSVGAPTDLDGNFTLKAEPGATLVVSYIGYETREVKVPASGKMKIILENDANQLDGVVVVGVLMKKSDLTGAVSHVDSEVLTQKPVTNINEACRAAWPVSTSREALPRATTPQSRSVVPIPSTQARRRYT